MTSDGLRDMPNITTWTREVDEQRNDTELRMWGKGADLVKRVVVSSDMTETISSFSNQRTAVAATFMQFHYLDSQHILY
jgi:hypothetical protein